MSPKIPKQQDLQGLHRDSFAFWVFNISTLLGQISVVSRDLFAFFVEVEVHRQRLVMLLVRPSNAGRQRDNSFDCCLVPGRRDAVLKNHDFCVSLDWCCLHFACF